MQNLTEFGQRAVSDIAQRYQLSNDAVVHMLIAVRNGGGTMAQFNCPELGGGGQWMQGGMTMVGDMFNNGLKATVENLCSELSNLLYNNPDGVFQPVRQAPMAGQHQQQSSGFGGNSIQFSGGFDNWWGDDFGPASSTGSQNNVRYAIFPQASRLAIEYNGQVTVYNTLDHQIGGVSQQQGGDASLSFTSQYGLVSVAQLPVVSVNGQAPSQSQPFQEEPVQVQSVEPAFEASPQSVEPVQPSHSPAADEEDIFAKIERLGTLKEKGFVTEDEFATKKAELLARL